MSRPAAAQEPSAPVVAAPVLVGVQGADEHVVRRWGGRAQGLLARHAPRATALADAVAPAGLAAGAVEAVHGELLHRLRTDPVAELRFAVATELDAAAAGTAAARLAGLRVRGEPAPRLVGVRLAVGEGHEVLLRAWLGALADAAERGAGAPEVELGALPDRVVVALAGGADADRAAEVRSVVAAVVGPGWPVAVDVEVEDDVRRARSAPVPDESSAASVAAAWVEHLVLLREAGERGLAAGYDVHPAHLVSRHLAGLVAAAG